MQPSDARILRGAAIPSVLAGAAAIVVGFLVGGAKGALGAAIATLVVIAFFSISVVAVSYASKISAQAMFAAAVFSYIFKIIGMFALISVFEGVTAWNNKVFAWTVIALTLVWIGAEIRHTLTTKTLYIDEPAEPVTTGAGEQAGTDGQARADEHVEAPQAGADRSP